MVHQCHVCGKRYTCKKSFKMKTKIWLKTLIFLAKFNLDYHVAHHFDERPFPCDFPGCTSAYKTKSDLRQHQKSHERALGLQFICIECNTFFDSSSKLNVHKRDVHSTKESSKLCELCNREFVNLRIHQKIVHDRLRPYVCDLDGKTFARLYGLNRHIESVHLNITPYTCKMCDKGFKETGALKK